MKGILLAGGKGTRLYPMTSIVSKQLQPIYNKPMVFYSLTTLMVAGCRDILVISSPDDIPRFESLLGDGERWGISLSYAVQDEPRGIADAFRVGAAFVGGDPSMLMLGDNLIYGRLDFLRAAVASHTDGATIFAYTVANPSEYGVVEFGPDGTVISLEEKPANPRSSWAVPGIYIYGPDVVDRARDLAPSARGELEITDLNRGYLAEGRLRAQPMGRGIAWLDTGTPEQLLNASNFVHAIEARQGLIIGSPEEVAFRSGYLDRAGLADAIAHLPSGPYRSYLERVVRD
ncbi:MAG: glucose-1-phosphate thymidylyltransferase RfbA [Myxococcales bacterium]|nr:glucose-1-phosphate thymidylyltransferase RfbA [Myxococcales bacterium]MCB9519971.1 glucose-1-phosphate thymidylyltransferase RfbA [Myxococcales bacterium]MCB9532518.1 glucose-1-phosphate thymidylyltransferase RfbA [Myxococcales bacterium]MCB9533118.1 glucose-1-phosphate thymidylyltransferase RfbA [Myxococcales bacterium]